MKDDWRLFGQEEYLENVKLKKMKFKKEYDEWQHQHCEFCGANISEFEGDLHEGYATEDKKFWICKKCYIDFKDMFNWKLEK